MLKKSVVSMLSGIVSFTMAGAALAGTANPQGMPQKIGVCQASIQEVQDYDRDGTADDCDVTVFLARNDAKGGVSFDLPSGTRLNEMMIADVSNKTAEPVYWTLTMDERREMKASVREGWILPGESQTIAIDVDLSSAESGTSVNQVVTLQVAGEVHRIPVSLSIRSAPPSTLAGQCTYTIYLDSLRVTKGQGWSEGDLEVEALTTLQTLTGPVAADWPSSGGYMQVPVGTTKTINWLMYYNNTTTGAHLDIPVNVEIHEVDDSSANDQGFSGTTLLFDCSEGMESIFAPIHVTDDSGGEYDVNLRIIRNGN